MTDLVKKYEENETTVRYYTIYHLAFLNIVRPDQISSKLHLSEIKVKLYDPVCFSIWNSKIGFVTIGWWLMSSTRMKQMYQQFLRPFLLGKHAIRVSPLCIKIIANYFSPTWHISLSTVRLICWLISRLFSDNSLMSIIMQHMIIHSQHFSMCYETHTYDHLDTFSSKVKVFMIIRFTCMGYNFAFYTFIFLKPKLWYTYDVIKWKHFPHYWSFVRGIPRPRWIPRTKASDAELRCFLWSAPKLTAE